MYVVRPWESDDVYEAFEASSLTVSLNSRFITEPRGDGE